MTCKHRISGAYQAECTYTHECVYKEAGAYLPTCGDIAATSPVTPDTCIFCGYPATDPEPGAQWAECPQCGGI